MVLRKSTMATAAVMRQELWIDSRIVEPKRARVDDAARIAARTVAPPVFYISTSLLADYYIHELPIYSFIPSPFASFSC